MELLYDRKSIRKTSTKQSVWSIVEDNTLSKAKYNWSKMVHGNAKKKPPNLGGYSTFYDCSFEDSGEKSDPHRLADYGKTSPHSPRITVDKGGNNNVDKRQSNLPDKFIYMRWRTIEAVVKKMDLNEEDYEFIKK